MTKKKQQRKKQSSIKKRNQKAPPKKRKVVRRRRPLTQEEIQRKRRREQRNRRKRMKRVRLSLFGATLIAALYHLIFFVTSILQIEKPIYKTLDYGVVDTSTQLVGLVLREEQLIETTDTAGVFDYIHVEGSKVNKDETVCITSNNLSIYSYKDKQEKIDEQLFRLAEKTRKNSYHYDTLYYLDQKNEKAIERFYESERTKENLSQLRTVLEKTQKEKTTIYIQDAINATKDIKTNRANLTHRINDLKNENKAPTDGIISYQTDFKETRYNAAEKITPLDVERATNNFVNLKNQQHSGLTGSSTPIYRLVSNDKATIVSFVSPEIARTHIVGSSYTYYYGEVNQHSLTLTLEQSEPQGNNYKLVFSTPEIEKVLNKRKIILTESKAAATGILIPKSAEVPVSALAIPLDYLSKEDEIYFVRVKDNDIPLRQDVSVLYKTETQAFVEIEPLLAFQAEKLLFHPTEDQFVSTGKAIPVICVYVKKGGLHEKYPVSVLLSNDKTSVVKSLDEQKQLTETLKILSNPQLLFALEGDNYAK